MSKKFGECKKRLANVNLDLLARDIALPLSNINDTHSIARMNELKTFR